MLHTHTNSVEKVTALAIITRAYVSATAKSLLQQQLHLTVPALLRRLLYPSISCQIKYMCFYS